MKRRTIFRKKRGGKFYGNWLVSVDGVDVNLGTKSATIAEKLVPEAERGRRDFKSDAQAAAEDLDQVAGGEGAAGGTEARDSSAGQTPSLPPAPPPPPAAQGGAPAQGQEQSQTPQLPQETAEEAARAEAEATNAAAAATDPSSPTAANDNAVPNLPPEVLDGFLRQAGAVMVDAQLWLQAYGIKRATGRVAGEIPPTAQVRSIAAEAWVAQLKIWFPSDKMLPPWAMALVLTAMCAPVQLATSTAPPPKDGEKPAENVVDAAA